MQRCLKTIVVEETKTDAARAKPSQKNCTVLLPCQILTRIKNNRKNVTPRRTEIYRTVNVCTVLLTCLNTDGARIFDPHREGTADATVHHTLAQPSAASSKNHARSNAACSFQALTTVVARHKPHPTSNPPHPTRESQPPHSSPSHRTLIHPTPSL
mmetsp:Transcript_17513/g.31687  ORF Transcript_17513/g.31687 Transcript_17513/m.31687 type:complete len:156 (+) Transcript_17513:1152-1619(+)